ncbi:MAG: polysaccharide deacetylase family protein, partial [Clostridiales bacterium]|nr:polysaccharide deacetylase family protein [Clostridiales bacterium]
MREKLKIKKYISLLLIAVFFIALGISATATSKVIFTVVNDQFSDLKDSTMPFEKNGKFYVPYSLFLNGFGGIKAYYSTQEQTLVLYDKEKIISFDIAHGFTYDQQMRTYEESAYTKNGTVFVPANFVCSMWGFYYSTISSSKGTVVRISKSTPSLSDSMLLYIGETVMTSLLEDYNNSRGNHSNGQPNTPTEGTPVSKPKKIVYLTFDSSPGDATSEILNTLSRYRYTATFFCTAENITAQDDIVRKIIIKGHSIGLNANSKLSAENFNNANAIIKQLTLVNDLLEKTAKTKTRVIRLTDSARSGLSKDIRDSLYLSGYRIWDYTIDASDKKSSYSISTTVINALKKTSRPAVVMLGNRPEDAKGLKAILSYLCLLYTSDAA